MMFSLQNRNLHCLNMQAVFETDGVAKLTKFFSLNLGHKRKVCWILSDSKKREIDGQCSTICRIILQLKNSLSFQNSSYSTLSLSSLLRTNNKNLHIFSWLSLTNTKCCCCLHRGETSLPLAKLLGTEGEAWLVTTELILPPSGCAADPLLVASGCCCCWGGWSTSAEDATGTVAELAADWPALLSTVPIILLPDWFGTSLLSSVGPRKHQHNYHTGTLLTVGIKAGIIILPQLSKYCMLW
jgi:hypothetical protein